MANVKPPVFRNEELQRRFDEDGFVKFPMFNKDQVARIHQFYIDHQNEHETIIDKKKFHATNETSNADLISAADSFLQSLMMEEIDKHFHNYKTIAANYLIKQVSIDSELGPHQDLRFVDEKKYYSFNVWVATEPTNKQNGGLRFIKGSHLWDDTIRPLPTYPWMYSQVSSLMEDYFMDIETDVGDCVVLNHACVHSSYPNLSEQKRIAAIIAMIPQDADILHYFLPDGDPQNEVEEYSMTLQDFINLKVGQRPQHAPLTAKFKYDFSPIGVDAFYQRAGLPRRSDPIKELTSYEQIKRKLSTLFRVSG